MCYYLKPDHANLFRKEKNIKKNIKTNSMTSFRYIVYLETIMIYTTLGTITNYHILSNLLPCQNIVGNMWQPYKHTPSFFWEVLFHFHSYSRRRIIYVLSMCIKYYYYVWKKTIYKRVRLISHTCSIIRNLLKNDAPLKLKGR